MGLPECSSCSASIGLDFYQDSIEQPTKRRVLGMKQLWKLS
ncbi:predicted protein [Botrytis cinerea T4]|uniref:Uncharacterized protein n=1 Tax=Botryotinia fuckeliana (strain T4) TaxID=999810 RepID=G2YQM3_BOTF4|nr:predicted protein [Botrytis cinerea T4]